MVRDIPRISEYITLMEDEIERCKRYVDEYDSIMDNDPLEYRYCLNCIKMNEVILYSLEKWERNLLLFDLYTDIKAVKDKCVFFSLSSRSYSVYVSNIKKKVKALCI